MPRANRPFLSGFVLHITIDAAASSDLSVVKSLRFVQDAKRRTDGHYTSFRAHGQRISIGV
jgi:hypothetical protein